MSVDIQVVAENLTELLTNTVDMAAVFYDIFLNPNPMDVDLKMFNNENKLITVTIPNRAKDRVVPYSGSGSPEGTQAAPIGSTYIDTATSTVYYKMSGEATDPYGWTAVISQNLMEIFIRTYLEARGYVTTTFLSTYLYNSVTQGAIPGTAGNSRSIVASNDTYGVVQVDGETIVENGSNQISVAGLVEDNDSNIVKLWVGEEPEYAALYQDGEKEDNTIYILKDKGQIVIGDIEVACNSFPSSMSESLSLAASGSTYTAPTNGWFLLKKVAGVSNAYLYILNNTTGYGSKIFLPTETDEGVVACPALKGETVTITYTATGTTNSFVFLNAASNRIEYSAS